MNKDFVNFMQKYTGSPIAVAVSGGVDSVALLYCLVEIGLKPVVLHVNHNLRDVAAAEAEYVENASEKLGLECKVFDWAGDILMSGLESAARDARYQLMTDYCKNNKIPYLMLAHQADDQIETFLMNLGRGSGLYGLAAMRTETSRDGITIVRPLLNVYRNELQDYCDKNNIKYFNDEMNHDEQYMRVKIRKNRHLLSKSLDISDDRILLAIQNLGRARDSIEHDVDALVSSVYQKGRAIFMESFLFDRSDEFRLKLLGCLIKTVGGDEYQPRLNSLESALDMLSSDCKFTLGHCTLRRFKNKIMIVPEGESTSFRKRR